MSDDMSISVFAEKWRELNDRFGVDRSGNVRDRYYEQINTRLSEDEFLAGVARVFYANTYFPSPKEIVDAARGGDHRRRLAHEDWLTITDALLSPSRAEEGWRDDLSEAGRKALDLIGGVRAVKRAERINLLRKDFVECHRDYAPPDAPPRDAVGSAERQAIEAEATGAVSIEGETR